LARYGFEALWWSQLSLGLQPAGPSVLEEERIPSHITGVTAEGDALIAIRSHHMALSDGELNNNFADLLRVALCVYVTSSIFMIQVLKTVFPLYYPPPHRSEQKAMRDQLK
jgi:hypothetical protein